MRGIRGAITIEKDEPEEVLAAVREMLQAVFSANPALLTQDIASAVFTVTEDIVSAFPALAARQIGWDQVPMICTREIPVPGSLPLCIRVLIHWNSDRKQEEIQHVYLRAAGQLRPDLTSSKPIEKA